MITISESEVMLAVNGTVNAFVDVYELIFIIEIGGMFEMLNQEQLVHFVKVMLDLRD